MFNSIQEFIDYKEQRPLICEGFTFTWSYLVEFNNKKMPERQELSIFSVINQNEVESLNDNEELIPKINYYVRCTNKGWGIEISELIRNYISGFVKVNSSPLSTIRKIILENLEMVKYVLLFLTFIVFAYFLSN